MFSQYLIAYSRGQRNILNCAFWGFNHFVQNRPLKRDIIHHLCLGCKCELNFKHPIGPLEVALSERRSI